MDSILLSIRKSATGQSTSDAFDVELIMHTNTAISILNQMGVGPKNGFSIVDDKQVWSDLLSNIETLEMVKTYMTNKVKLLFDPPTNGAVLEALTRTTGELEWRIQAEAESILAKAATIDTGGT